MTSNRHSFEADLRREIQTHLPIDFADLPSQADLAAMPTSRMLLVFWNWLGRLIHPHRRTVKKSPMLLENPTYKLRREIVHHIFGLTAIGNDLQPYLSRDLRFGYRSSNSGRRRDLDLLLNDWGIHHLHLSRNLEPDGYVTRDGPVLCAIFREENAYFLDVVQHGEWAETRLVEIAVRSWPDANLFLKLGLLTGQTIMTSPERKALRQNHYTTTTVVDGHVYLPAGFGISSAGMSSKQAVQAGQFLRRLHVFENDTGLLCKAFSQAEGYVQSKWPRHPDFHLVHISSPTRYCFAINERTTGLYVGI